MYAFVVFNDARDMKLAKRTLRRCWLYCSWKYLFRKWFWLTALDTADSPSNIIWENLQVPWWERVLRNTVTLLGIFVILVISFGIIYTLKAFQNNGLPNSATCKYTNPITLDKFSSGTTTQQQCFCSVQGFWKIFFSANLYSLCTNFFWYHILSIVIGILVSLAISLINFFMKILLVKLSHF